MQSAQDLAGSKGAQYGVEDRFSRLEDDTYSLNSWSDELPSPRVRNTAVVERQQSQQSSWSRPTSSSSTTSDPVFVEWRYNGDHDVTRTGRQKQFEGNSNSRRLSANSTKGSKPVCREESDGIVAVNGNDKSSVNVACRRSSTSSITSQSKPRAIGVGQRSHGGNNEGVDTNRSVTVQNEFPPSLNLKSASFEYPSLSLWGNSSRDEIPHPTSVINNVDNQTPFPTRSKERSSTFNSLKDAQTQNLQRLYPDLNDLRIDERDVEVGEMHPSIPKEVSSSHHDSSKSSPSGNSNRPQFFDFQRSNLSKARKKRNTYDPQNGTQSSSNECTSSQLVHNFPESSGGMNSKRSSYYGNYYQGSTSSPFKSQPNVCAPQRGCSVKPNNSANDLESMSKQSWEHILERENVKSKVMTVWNNIKYGWTFKAKTTIKLDSPLFLLGKVYHKRSDDDDEQEFLKDFTSRIWLTYRSNFYPIPGTKFTNDCGWGCMLRSGQMLLAQCFVSHFLGRDWRIHNSQNQTQLLYYKEILRWLSDPVEAPSDKAPFCLHHLVSFGRYYNKVPGEWYGPASVAYILRDSLNRANLSIPILKDLCIYVAQDCTVFIDDINKLCRSRVKSGSAGSGSYDHASSTHEVSSPEYASNGTNTPWLRSLVILIPVRLGGEVMNDIYSPCIKSLLSYNNCMGIIGGKPKHSLYFLGWQDDKLIYLDPHYCRDAVDTSNKDFSIETYHCMSPRKLSMTKMDPSCTVGFYIRDHDEFLKFVHDVTEFISPPKQKGLYPLFIFNNGSQQEVEMAQSEFGMEQGRVKVRHYVIDQNGQRQRTRTRESEEFIML